MKMKTRSSNDFLKEADSLAHESKVLLKQIAAYLQVNPVILEHWIKGINQPEETVLTDFFQVRDIRMTTLMGERVRVEKERDFLKEALSFLAKAPC